MPGYDASSGGSLGGAHARGRGGCIRARMTCSRSWRHWTGTATARGVLARCWKHGARTRIPQALVVVVATGPGDGGIVTRRRHRLGSRARSPTTQRRAPGWPCCRTRQRGRRHRRHLPSSHPVDQPAQRPHKTEITVDPALFDGVPGRRTRPGVAFTVSREVTH